MSAARVRYALALAGSAVGLPDAALAHPQATSPASVPTVADYRRAVAAAERAALAATRAAQAAEEAARNLRTIADGLSGADGLNGGPPAPVQADATDTKSGWPAGENLPVDSIVKRRAQTQALAVEAIQSGAANGPNDRLLKSSPTPDLQFVASSDDTVASLAWTLDISRAPTGDRLSADHLTMTATSDLDSNHEARILGLDGFPGGAEVSLSYIHYSTALVLDGREKAEVTRARANCLDDNIGKADATALCDPYAFPTGASMFVARYHPAGLRQMMKTVLPGNVTFYGLQAAASQTDYTYLDRAAFTIRDQSKLGFKATAFGGVLLGQGQSSLTGSFTYGRRYKANDPVTLCQPITAPQTQCLTEADGAPVRKDKAIVAFEARHAFDAPIGQFATLAIAPQVSVDFKAKAFSLDLPLYFVGDGTGKLRGGVRGVYLNRESAGGGREDDVSLGLFVGVPFSVLGH